MSRQAFDLDFMSLGLDSSAGETKVALTRAEVNAPDSPAGDAPAAVGAETEPGRAPFGIRVRRWLNKIAEHCQLQC